MTHAGIGAVHLGGDSTFFRVWAPGSEHLQVRLIGQNRLIDLERDMHGYHSAIASAVTPGDHYLLRFDDGTELPDPASRWQPEGVHGPSAVVDLAFPWTDANWRTPPLADFVIYELHVGTFSREGTFTGVIKRLDHLVSLGVTAVEIMPVAQFPGARNWGYDGVFPFAVHNTYGGPVELMRLVDACHAHGLAVILDVVYNHLGPEGNVLDRFAPYFHDAYRTPWGRAINFDGAYSDDVRYYFLENTLQWLRDYHFDALRLDAVHGILDPSAYPFLAELADQTGETSRAVGRSLWLIAESDLNDPRLLQPRNAGGYGLHAQWLDDFHHALHALLTGEADGYYADFGRLEDLSRCLQHGFAFTGQYSTYRRRRHGQPPRTPRGDQFVVCLQNHDQVGNRMRGERISVLVSFEALKLGAALVLLSPFIPLLFMGEEYGETRPFPYFVSHADPELVEAVRAGREREFADFAWAGEPPDPQADHTFQSAVLTFDTSDPDRSALFRLYRELIALRRRIKQAGVGLTAFSVDFDDDQRTLAVTSEQALLVCSFRPAAALVRASAGKWKKILDTADPAWNGPGGSAQPALRGGDTIDMRPWNAVLYQKQQ